MHLRCYVSPAHEWPNKKALDCGADVVPAMTFGHLYDAVGP